MNAPDGARSCHAAVLQDLPLDLSRFDAAPLIAFTATQEMNDWTETDGRISPRYWSTVNAGIVHPLCVTS